jgi:hypothetical protein
MPYAKYLCSWPCGSLQEDFLNYSYNSFCCHGNQISAWNEIGSPSTKDQSCQVWLKLIGINLYNTQTYTHTYNTQVKRYMPLHRRCCGGIKIAQNMNFMSINFVLYLTTE